MLKQNKAKKQNKTHTRFQTLPAKDSWDRLINQNSYGITPWDTNCGKQSRVSVNHSWLSHRASSSGSETTHLEQKQKRFDGHRNCGKHHHSVHSLSRAHVSCFVVNNKGQLHATGAAWRLTEHDFVQQVPLIVTLEWNLVSKFKMKSTGHFKTKVSIFKTYFDLFYLSETITFWEGKFL